MPMRVLHADGSGNKRVGVGGVGGCGWGGSAGRGAQFLMASCSWPELFGQVYKKGRTPNNMMGDRPCMYGGYLSPYHKHAYMGHCYSSRVYS